MNEFAPPQGINFSSEMMPASALTRALCRVVSFIQQVEPHGALLKQYDDWWEHDGLHFYKGEIDIHKLFRMVSSPRSLIQVMPGEEDAFIGIAPQSDVWYLRFNLSWDDAGYELNGSFDITLPDSLAVQFEDQVIGWLGIECIKRASAVFYQRIRSR